MCVDLWTLDSTTTYSSRISSLPRTLRAQLWTDLLTLHSLRSKSTALERTVYTRLFTGHNNNKVRQYLSHNLNTSTAHVTQAQHM